MQRERNSEIKTKEKGVANKSAESPAKSQNISKSQNSPSRSAQNHPKLGQAPDRQDKTSSKLPHKITEENEEDHDGIQTNHMIDDERLEWDADNGEDIGR